MVKSPTVSSLGIKSIKPPGSKGLFLSCLAKPLSISSLRVIALSKGSPRLPSLTSCASFIESRVSRNSLSTVVGIFFKAGTLVLIR